MAEDSCLAFYSVTMSARVELRRCESVEHLPQPVVEKPATDRLRDRPRALMSLAAIRLVGCAAFPPMLPSKRQWEREGGSGAASPPPTPQELLMVVPGLATALAWVSSLKQSIHQQKGETRGSEDSVV